jgi:hypothetical protein
MAVALSCASDDQPSPLYGKVVERRSLEVGGTEAQTVTLGTKNPVTILIPGDVAPMRVRVNISLVTETARRGRFPVNDTGVLVEPQDLQFAAPVRVRQLVPPPPPTRRYMAVVVTDRDDSFVTRGRARLVTAATAETGGLELWEGDGTGSGLWGLAVSDDSDLESVP